MAETGGLASFQRLYRDGLHSLSGCSGCPPRATEGGRTARSVSGLPRLPADFPMCRTRFPVYQASFRVSGGFRVYRARFPVAVGGHPFHRPASSPLSPVSSNHRLRAREEQPRRNAQVRRPEAAHRVQVEWPRLSPGTTHTWLPPVSTGGVRPLTEPRFVVTFISVKFAGTYQQGSTDRTVTL